MFGKDSKKKELIKNLSAIYEGVQREHQISPGDFPDIGRMQVIRWGLVFQHGFEMRALVHFQTFSGLMLRLRAGLSETGAMNDIVSWFSGCDVVMICSPR